MDIKKIKSTAEKALSKIEGNGQYNTKYVLRRLNASLLNHPKDQVIGTVRDVVRKVAESKEFISKKELSEIHGHLSGLNKHSYFRDELGDLIFKSHNLDYIKRDASKNRVNAELNISSGLEEGTDLHKMAKEFAGVFNFENESFSTLGENCNSKAEKFVTAQFKSMGLTPKSVRAVTSNNHFVLCKAAFPSSSFNEVSVAIPVGVSNGIPEIPNKFINNGQIESLNKENILVYLKANEEMNSRSRKSKYASQRDDMFDKTWSGIKSTSNYGTQLDDSILESQSKFSSSQINLGRSVIDSELKSFGFKTNNIRYASSDNNKINYTALIPGFDSEISIDVPFSNGRPLIPGSFVINKTSRKFSEFELRKISSANKSSELVRTSGKNLNNMSYNEIVSEMSKSAIQKDYRAAEDCLSFLQTKFGGQEYLNALNKFSSILKHSSIDSDRDALVKAALHRGDLIKVPTSIELYSPKYAMPLSKLAFDEKGNLVPARSMAGSEESTYYNISSSKIALT